MGINFELTKGLGTKRAGKGGEYFTAGYNYHYVVESCKWLKSREGDEFVVVECQIIDSDCPTQGPGRKPAIMINMSKDAGAGNLADFLRYHLSKFAEITEGVKIDPDDDEYWEGILEDKSTLVSVLEEEQMLVGVEMYMYTKPIKTRKNQDFTLHLYSLEKTNGEVGAVAKDRKETN